MEIVTGNTLEELYDNVVKKVSSHILENLIITGTFKISELDDNSFLQLNEKKANDWKMVDCPPHLYFNHGHYITEKGYKFLKEELKRKKNSHRACLSLINMKDIIGSGDKPIPSFMNLQASYSNSDKTKLLVTSYYRALEVSQFLKINIAETCLTIKELIHEFDDIETFELTIIAFKAQIMENFHCLEKAEIDRIDNHLLSIHTHDKDKESLLRLLQDKKDREESIIETKGLDELLKQAKYEKFPFVEGIEKVIADMNILKEKREKNSAASTLKRYTKEVQKSLKELIEDVEGWSS